MNSNLSPKNTRHSFIGNPKTPLVLMVVSIIAFAYYLLGYAIFSDVYLYPVVGAIYEILWLPMMLSVVAIPIISILILINRHTKKTLALISLVLIAVVIFILISV